MIKEYIHSQGPALAFEFTGRLDESDYSEMTKVVNDAIARYGKVRILVRLHEFSGWTPSGFWRDFRFSRNHTDSIERFAVVGESNWQKALIELGKPLTKAEVKYFPANQHAQAWAWIEAQESKR